MQFNMKRIILILCLTLIGLLSMGQQVGDATIKTYTDTYINSNGTGSITGAQLNTDLNYLISSKVNHDSATTVRVAATKDTIFVTYWGYAEDTIPLGGAGDTSIWASNGTDKIYTKAATDYVGIGTSNPMTRLHLVDSSGALGVNPYMYSTSTGAYPQLNFGKYNGLPSSFAAIDSGTMIGGVNFGASYSAASLGIGASMRVKSIEDWDADNRGASITLSTIPEGDNVASDVLTIVSNKVGIGTASPDSSLHVADGATFGTDILVGGGWNDWTPTIAWTPATPTAATVNEARYQVVNNTVYFKIDINGTNDSGSTLLTVSFTPPIAIPDIDAITPCSASTNEASKVSTPSRLVLGYIDAETNLKIYVITLSINNTANYRLVLSGFYEITGK